MAPVWFEVECSVASRPFPPFCAPDDVPPCPAPAAPVAVVVGATVVERVEEAAGVGDGVQTADSVDEEPGTPEGIY